MIYTARAIKDILAIKHNRDVVISECKIGFNIIAKNIDNL